MWKVKLSPDEAAGIIERFLKNEFDGYPGEWGDFVEAPQQDEYVERYRRRALELSPLVNERGPQDPAAIEELKSMVKALRSRGSGSLSGSGKS